MRATLANLVLTALLPEKPQRIHVSTIAEMAVAAEPRLNLDSLRKGTIYQWVKANWPAPHKQWMAPSASVADYPAKSTGAASGYQWALPEAKERAETAVFEMPVQRAAEPAELIAADRKVTQASAKEREARRKYDALLKAHEELEDKFNILCELDKQRPVGRIDLEPETEDSPSHEAVPVLQCSDWHVEEPVTMADSGGKNEFNLDICEARVKALARNAVKVIRQERSAVRIREMVVHLGGDFISGHIHPELIQINLLSPIQALAFAQDRICYLLRYLAQNSGCQTIHVVCNDGNHGRSTPKLQVATRVANSFEWLLYTSVNSWVEATPGLKDVVKVYVPDSAITHFPVFGVNLRFTHGDIMRYKGGVGGLSVPAHKQIYRWNDSEPAIHTFFGHFHCYQFPTPDATCNGSLIGYNAFARQFGFKYEPPRQALTLVDSKYGITKRTPIFCE